MYLFGILILKNSQNSHIRIYMFKGGLKQFTIFDYEQQVNTGFN